MPNLDSLKKLFNYKLIFSFTAVVFVTLVAISLVGTNVLATQGYAVSEAETRTMQLEKENEILSVKIEEATRLGNLEKLAESRGFNRTKSVVFLPEPQNLASR